MSPRLFATLLCATLAAGCRTPDKDGTDGILDDDGLTDATDDDGDGHFGDEDCNDADASVHPAAEEICNGVDDNCDGQVDEGVMDTWWADRDGDGFGDPAAATEACAAPSDHVSNANDCDDADDSIFPGAPERCNGVDDDCDVDIDEDVTSIWYSDADDDGFGDPASETDDCDPGPGWTVDGSDCDDTDASVFPGAEEVCNEVDDDCDELVDEGVTTTFFVDLDSDGHGSVTATTEACSLPEGYADTAFDCDDANPLVNPDATEVCNGIDDDCDADIDDSDSSLDTSTADSWYADTDGDGFGDPGSVFLTCVQHSNTVADNTDCDDTEASVNPAATEVCNSIDDDCDGDVDDDDSSLDTSTASTFYDDDDADGYGDASASSLACDAPTGTVSDSTDCDDTNAAVHPAATEVCNSIDDDCDGDVDDDDSSLDTSTASTFYDDDDGDGYGDATASSLACDAPTGKVSDSTDCDDTSAAVHPAATEVCNGIDDDCDGDVDDDDSSLDTSTASTFYDDDDGDGYGDPSASTLACNPPTGTVTDNTDCDDSSSAAYPGATELCNDEDDDCDGDVDNGVIGSGSTCAGTSCEDILLAGSSSGDGTYYVEGTSGSVFDVWCDMTTDGGGWTLAGSVVNDGSRNWDSYTDFTSTTTWGSISASQTADFKSDAWTDLDGDDFMVVTADYDVAWYGILGLTDVSSWIAGEYNSSVCSTSFLGHTPDYSDGLTATEAATFSLTVRPLDSNCSCFPGCNESVMIGLMNASCCWVAGLGNAPNGQASWRTHDLSLLDVGNITPETCTAGTWPCNDDGYYADDSGFCYDSSCKQTFAEVYIR